MSKKKECNPAGTVIKDGLWIQAYSPTYVTPKSIMDGGKLLIFMLNKPEDYQRLWEPIKEAILKGDLGPRAKVSDPNCPGTGPTAVICVYNSDVEDKAEILRIRKGLRQLGIRGELKYKTNRQTYIDKR